MRKPGWLAESWGSGLWTYSGQKVEKVAKCNGYTKGMQRKYKGITKEIQRKVAGFNARMVDCRTRPALGLPFPMHFPYVPMLFPRIPDAFPRSTSLSPAFPPFWDPGIGGHRSGLE